MSELDHRQLLVFLLARLEADAPELHRVVVGAIDAGKEVPDVRSERGKPRSRYRTERLSDTEALAVAFNVLSSYFEELPKVLNSVEENFRLASLGVGDAQYGRVLWSSPAANEGAPISIEVEQRTAERFSEAEEFWSLKAPPAELIEEQSRNLDEVFRLAGMERGIPWLR